MKEAAPDPRGLLPDHAREFIAQLDADDIETLKRVISVFRMVHGWCRVNRWLFIGAVAALVLFSQGLDAVKNVASYWTRFFH